MSRRSLGLVIVALFGIGFLLLFAVAFVALPSILDWLSPAPSGVVLIFEVDRDASLPGEWINMDLLARAVDRRLNHGGWRSRIADVSVSDRQYIKVALYSSESDEAERVARLLSRTGMLEFRILANERDNKPLIDRAIAEPAKSRILDESGNLLARWVPVKRGEEESFKYSGIATRRRKVGDVDCWEVLVLKDRYDVTGTHIARAQPGADMRGRPCIDLSFNRAGGQFFGLLTSSHLPDEQTGFAYRLGIILNGEVFSAPAIQSTITENAQITGNFTIAEVQELADLLMSGSLPARLRLVGRQNPP